MLAPNFEVRNGSHPITSVPKQEWITANFKHENNQVPREMAVREFGDIHVVSYLYAAKDQPNGEFIVDVWKNENGNSKLMARYIPGVQ